MKGYAPKRPVGLRARGRKFWDTVLQEFDVSDGEVELLGEVCRCLDELDQLNRAVREQGVTTVGSRGQIRPHPALESARATRTLLGRLLAQLDLPDPEGEAVPSPERARAQKAAKARWDQVRAQREARRGQAS